MELRPDNEQNEADGANYYKVVRPLQTYERDIAESMRERNTSQISVNLEEKKEERKKLEKQGAVLTDKREVQENDSDTSKSSSIKKIFIIFFLFLIILGGIIVLPKIWSTYTTKEPPKVSVLQPETLLKGDVIIKINITGKTREEIISLIQEELKNSPQKELGSIIIIYPIEIVGGEVAVSGERFLKIMAQGTPGAFLRALGNKVTLGYQVREEGYAPFLQLEISSFENAYSNMLSWERTIALDLLGFITEIEENRLNANFEDQIILEKDARVLRKIDGRTALIYSFLNKNTLFITNRTETFRAIVVLTN